MNIKNLKRILKLKFLPRELWDRLVKLKAVYEKEEKLHSVAMEKFKEELEKFLKTSADIAVYGGAVGSGKTCALLNDIKLRGSKMRLYQYHIRMVEFYFKKRMSIKHILKIGKNRRAA